MIHVYKNHLVMYSWLTTENIWKTMCLQLNQYVILYKGQLLNPKSNLEKKQK